MYVCNPADILATILDISKCLMVPGWHQLDSVLAVPNLQKSEHSNNYTCVRYFQVIGDFCGLEPM